MFAKAASICCYLFDQGPTQSGHSVEVNQSQRTIKDGCQ